MGCDIHTRIEYLDRKGTWTCGDFFRKNPHYNPNPDPEDPQFYESNPYTVVEVCSDRNYELFAVLADVRNYSDNPYIADPKGIPEDACAETVQDYKEWDVDAHSASWFTLRELLDWSKEAPATIKRSGMVSPEQSAKLDAGETPYMWCGWTSMDGWVYREWEEEYRPLDHLISELKQRGRELWLWWNDEQMEANADKLRFVFWFDN